MPMGFGAQADALKVFLNRATWGLTGDSSAAEQHLGAAAPLASIPGVIAGIVGPAKVAKGAAMAARALPRLALGGVRALGGAQGASRAETLARLGIQRAATQPSVAGRAIAAIRNNPKKSYAGLGLGAFALDSAGGSNGEPAMQAPMVAPPAAAGSGYSSSVMDPIPDSLRTPDAPVQPMTFESMLASAAEANGGKLSIGQMGALADVMYKTAPRGRQPTAKDMAGEKLVGMADAMLQRDLATAAANPDRAAGAAQAEKAYAGYSRMVGQVIGADPWEQYLADHAANQE